jgi:hypothetical protein
MADEFIEKLRLVERLYDRMDERGGLFIGPLPLKHWCVVYGHDYKKSRHKMSKLFKDQVFRNKRISSQEYSVHLDDLPFDYRNQVLLGANIEDLKDLAKRMESKVGVRQESA